MAHTFSLLTKQLLALGLLTTQVTAHGYIQGIVADRIFYQGYRPSYQYLTSPPQLAGWSAPQNLNNGFVNNYSSPDIICHLGATPGQAYATVQAGNSIELQWTNWPIGHLGPVLTYLANCNGECTTVDKNSLLFNKIDEVGLIDGSHSPGKWAADELIANNNSWTLQIPADIAPGNYVLRHEIIALSEAMYAGGAQNYPQCINIKVTGRGTNSLQNGTKGTSLYTSQDPGILIDIYQALSNYIIPGPPLLNGVVSTNFTRPGLNATTTVTFPNVAATTTASTSILNASTTATTSAMSTTMAAGIFATVVSTTTSSNSVPSMIPTTFQTLTTSSSTTASASATTYVVVGGYGGQTVTVTVTNSGAFAEATNTTLPWAPTGTGRYNMTGTAYATGTISGTGFYATGTVTGSAPWATFTGEEGFVGVSIDNGFRGKQRARRILRGSN